MRRRRSSSPSHRRACFGALALVLAAMGCATESPLIRASAPPVTSSRTNIPLTVLVPSIEFVDVQTDTLLPSGPYGADSLANFIVQVACEALDRPDLVCAGTRGAVAPGRGDDLRRFVSESRRAVSASDLPQWVDLLMAIAAGDSTRCVLVHHVRAKIGPGGYWNPFNGAIGTEMLSTHLRAALVECSTGKVIRRSEAFVRARPDPKQAAFVAAIRTAYQKLR